MQPSDRMRRRSRALLVGIGALIALLIPAYLMGLRLNATASLPLGLYLRTNDPTQFVSFCLAGEPGRLALQRQYVAPGYCPTGGYPLLKKLVALPGDTVTLSAAGISVNGQLLPNTAPRRIDDWGKEVQHYPFGTYQVPTDTYWVASTYDNRSYDSRYYGPIHAAEIVSHLRPLWINW